MTAAVRAYVDHAFGTWELNRVTIRAVGRQRPQPRDPRAPRLQRGGHLREVERVGGHARPCRLLDARGRLVAVNGHARDDERHARASAGRGICASTTIPITVAVAGSSDTISA